LIATVKQAMVDPTSVNSDSTSMLIDEILSKQQQKQQQQQPDPPPPSPLLNSDYLKHLETLSSIPKIAHVMFPNATTLPANIDKFDLLQHNIVGEIEKKTYNAEWTLKLYDDEAVHQIIKRAAQDGLIPLEEEVILQHAHIVEKTNLARVLLMYTEGGLYLDVDRTVNIPLDQIIGDYSKTKMLLPTYYDINFMQDAMCTAPRNRLYLQLLNHMTERRLRGGPNGTPLPRKDGWLTKSDLFSLGPDLFRSVVMQVVFEKPRIEMEQAREAIHMTKLIRTAKDEWCDGMFVKPFEGCKHINREALYWQYGLGRWDDQVEKNGKNHRMISMFQLWKRKTQPNKTARI
jgi:hypothetical protein